MHEYSLFEEQVLSLAGVAQATALVHKIASNESFQEEDLKCSLKSALIMQVDSTVDLYGDISGVHLGLQQLKRIFLNKQQSRNDFIARYMLETIVLQKKAFKNSEILGKLTTGIESLSEQLDPEDIDNPFSIGRMASLYTQTLSTMSYRVHIHGNKNQLAQSEVLQKIRALLLAAIRAVHLWRHNNGKFYQLIFQKRKIGLTAEQLLRYNVSQTK